MKSKKKLAKTVFNLFRILPGWGSLLLLPAEKKALIFEEMDLWNRIRKLENSSHFGMFSELMVSVPEYRNLVQFRAGSGAVKLLLQFLFPPMETLYICTDDIGPRLFIQHGFATMISAKKIGSDCWINQQVTIGYKGEGNAPVIGNGVMITSGAKVLGAITVGDNSIIGANAVVVKDIPANSVAVGVPAKVIKENPVKRYKGISAG